MLVIGSSNTDMIIQVARIPKSGETILGGEFATAAGGKGANQAVSAARAGGAVTFIARVGHDIYGAQAIAGFIGDGINVDHLVRDSASPSGVALIYVGKGGQNSIAVASGANSKLCPADFRNARPAFRDARVVLLQLETPLKTVEAAIRLAVAEGTRIILNPAPAQALSKKLLEQVFLLTPNESEAELLTGVVVKNEAAAEKAAEKLLARGVQNVIVTLGARGAYVAGKNVRQLIPGYKVKAVDATGAGDVFNGAVAVALAEGRGLLEAARFASAAAAISVTRLGAQTAAPRRGEIEDMLTTGKVRNLGKSSVRKNGSNGWSHHSNTRKDLKSLADKTMRAGAAK